MAATSGGGGVSSACTRSRIAIVEKTQSASQRSTAPLSR